jgi:hypothetical protein
MFGAYCVLEQLSVTRVKIGGEMCLPTKVNQVKPTQKGNHMIIDADTCPYEDNWSK